MKFRISFKEKGKVYRKAFATLFEFQTFIEDIEGGPVPLERMMITPDSLSQAGQLELCYTSY